MLSPINRSGNSPTHVSQAVSAKTSSLLLSMVNPLPHEIEKIYEELCTQLPTFSLEEWTCLKKGELLLSFLSATPSFRDQQLRLARELAAWNILRTEERSPGMPQYEEALYCYSVVGELDPERDGSFDSSKLLLRVALERNTFVDRLERASNRPDDFQRCLDDLDKLERFCVDSETEGWVKSIYRRASTIFLNQLPAFIRENGQIARRIKDKLDTPIAFSSTPFTKSYLGDLKEYRNSFSSSKRSTVREQQNEIAKRFKAVVRRIVENSVALLGEAPCAYDLLAMGSAGREECFPYSDLEYLLLFENPEKRPYFAHLAELIRLQFVTLGETPNSQFSFSCVKQIEGLRIDSGGDPSQSCAVMFSPLDIIERWREPKEIALNDPVRTALKVTSLLSEEKSALQQQYEAARKEIWSPERLQQWALIFLQLRLKEMKPPSNISDLVDVKKDYIEFLHHLLADLSLYFGIEDTNTLDIIDQLVSRRVFAKESGKLIKELIEGIHHLRTRLHLLYGRQEDRAFFGNASSVAYHTLTQEEKQLLERGYWLVLFPLYGALRGALDADSTSFAEVFHELDLLQIAFQEMANYPQTDFTRLIANLAQVSDDPVYYFRLLSKSSESSLRRVFYDHVEQASARALLEEIPDRSGYRLSFEAAEKRLQDRLNRITTDTPEPTTHPTIQQVLVVGSRTKRWMKPEFFSMQFCKDGTLLKPMEESNHHVVGLGGIYFKMLPMQPAMEYAVHSLLFRLGGHLTPSTELVRFELTVNGKQVVYPVLLSEEIAGSTLKQMSEADLLTKLDNSKAWNQWTWLLLGAILTGPGDGRLSNYVMGDLPYCVDNDVSFVEPIVNWSFSKQVFFYCSLFCFAAKKPLSVDVLREFCSLDVQTILYSWIEDLVKREEEQVALFSKSDRKTYYKKGFRATLLLKEGRAATLFVQFMFLQNQLREALAQGRVLYPRDLLNCLLGLADKDILQKPIGIEVRKRYEREIAKGGSVSEQMARITSRPLAAGSLSISQTDLACLGKILAYEELEAKRLYSLSEAREELYAILLNTISNMASVGEYRGKNIVLVNFRDLQKNGSPDLARQERVLKMVTLLASSCKQKPVSLTFHHCAVLTGSKLERLFSDQVESVDLRYCRGLKDGDVLQLAALCPNLRSLTFRGCNALKSISSGYYVREVPVQFPKLQLLSLERCAGITNLVIAAPSLNQVILRENFNLQLAKLDFASLPKITIGHSAKLQLTIPAIPRVLDRGLLEKTEAFAFHLADLVDRGEVGKPWSYDWLKAFINLVSDGIPPSSTEISFEKDELDILLRLVCISDRGVRLLALYALSKRLNALRASPVPFIREDNKVVYALIQLSLDEDEKVCESADSVIRILNSGTILAASLAILGKDRIKAADILSKNRRTGAVFTDLLQGADASVRMSACEVLVNFDFDSVHLSDLEKTAIHLLHDRESTIKIRAADFLKKIKSQHLGALLGLVELLQDSDEAVSLKASHDLSEIELQNPESMRELVKVLVPLLQNKKRRVRDVAANLFVSIDPASNLEETLVSFLEISENEVVSIASLLILYDSMTIQLFRRQLEGLGIKRVLRSQTILIHQLVTPYRECLEKIAFLSQEAGGKTVKPDIYGPLLEGISELQREEFGQRLFNELGFLAPKGDHKELFLQYYAFILPSFEEYFAARHLVSLLGSPAQLANAQSAAEWLRANRYFVSKSALIDFAASLAQSNEQLSALAEGLLLDRPDVGEDSPWQFPLYRASKLGLLRLSTLLILKGAKVDAANQDGQQPLHYAASGGHVEIVELLLIRGAMIDASDKHRLQPIHMAAKYGHKEVVELLLDRGAKIDATDKGGDEPLHLAAHYGHIGVVELLLSRGAKVNAVDERGQQPLHIAAEYGNTEVVELLLNRGAKIDAADKNSRQPLHIAAEKGHKEVVKLMINKGIKLDATGNFVNDLLHWAVYNSYEKVVEQLLNSGAKVDAIGKFRQQPLHIAAEKGHKEVVEQLLNSGAKVDAIGKFRQQPLHIAVEKGRKEVVELLLSRGAMIDAVDEGGKQPLHLAASNGHKDVVELLLNRGAKIDAADNDGMQPLHLAASNGHKDVVVELLLYWRANIEAADNDGMQPLHLAASNGHKEVVEMLLYRGAKLDAAGKDGKQPLHWAASNGRKDVVELLLNRGAKIDSAGKVGDQPLHTAALNGHKEVVKLLLEKGAKVDAANKDGSQPLHAAALNGHKEVVKFLLEKGAKIDIANNEGNQPLHFAARNGQKEVVELLISKGAKVKTANKDGRQPLHFAAQYGHKEVVELLLKKGAKS